MYAASVFVSIASARLRPTVPPALGQHPMLLPPWAGLAALQRIPYSLHSDVPGSTSSREFDSRCVLRSQRFLGMTHVSSRRRSTPTYKNVVAR